MSPWNWNEKAVWIKKVLASTATVPVPDAKTIFAKAPFIQYEQILLDKNFRQYLGTVMVSKNILRMGTQKNTNTENIWNKCRAGLTRNWLFRSTETIWLAWTVNSLWQKRQTHNNIR